MAICSIMPSNMPNRKEFDESLREDVLEFRRRLEEAWPKFEEVGLSGYGFRSHEQALERYPHLKVLYSEGRPVVRSVACLSSEDGKYPPNSGYDVTVYWGDLRNERERPVLRSQIQLYPSGVGLVCQFDFSGLQKGQSSPRVEYIPDGFMGREHLPMVKAIIECILEIADAV